MAQFEDHYPSLLRHEGGYVYTADPDDIGGKTFAGISHTYNPNWEGWQYLDENGNILDKQSIEWAVATLYKTKYWNAIHGDELIDPIASAMLSSCVLDGNKRAIAMMQAGIGAAPDGIMGPNTLKAIDAKLDRLGNDGITLMLALFAIARIARYVALVLKRPSQRKWLLGWIRRALEDT